MHLVTENVWWHRFYVGCFGTMVVMGCIYSWKAISTYQLDQQKSIIKGQVALDVEHYYNNNFIAKDVGTQFWALINYVVLKEGRKGVIIGDNSWLYTLEEFKDYSAAESNLSRNLEQVVAVAGHLKKQGIGLLVSLVPAKAEIYPEYTAGRRVAPIHNKIYDQALARFGAANIPTPDLRAALQNAKSHTPVFLKSDTHWTIAGAQVVATSLAHTIRAQQLAGNLDSQMFENVEGRQRQFQGDLLNYIPLGTFSNWVSVSSDQFVEVSTEVKGSSASADDLFGDTSPEITLVGTSYSANPTWNFVGALRKSLGTDLVNHAQEGKGPFVPMQEYLSSSAFADSPPVLIIWEIPARFLAAPQEHEKFSTILTSIP